jgi:DNA mismatch endonuclease (patch repair protein)
MLSPPNMNAASPTHRCDAVARGVGAGNRSEFADDEIGAVKIRIAAHKRRLTLSERMARIRKVDTKPELAVRRIVHAMGYRFRLHVRGLPGNPDIVLPRHRKIIFVHGCFWHRHDCPDGRKLPSSKPEYWGPKLERNRHRDEESIMQLSELGWRVLVIWECEIRDADALRSIIYDFLRSKAAGEALAQASRDPTHRSNTSPS